jgi:hypothetical protein
VILLITLIALYSNVQFPGVGVIAQVATWLLPAPAVPSFYSVVVLATQDPNADVGGVVQRLLAAGVRQSQVRLIFMPRYMPRCCI